MKRRLSLAALCLAACSNGTASSSDGAGGAFVTGGAAGTGATAGSAGSAGSVGSGGAGADAGTVDAGEGGVDPTLCLPFERPTTVALRASPHKVLAHYFSPFPISLDDKAPDQDYYTKNYLAPGGESGKWLPAGGYLRDRPLPRAPTGSTSWALEDMKTEVARASAMGLDGFTFDILSVSGTHWTRLQTLLSAVAAVDPGFKVALMPDMYAELDDPDAALARKKLVDAVVWLAENHGSVLLHSQGGHLVLSPYGAEKRDAAWWKATLDALASAGVAVDFLPLFSNTPWADAASAMKAVVPMLGVASWGRRTPAGAVSLGAAPKTAHDLGLLWMAPVATQDMRPKTALSAGAGTLWEAEASLTLRAQWEATIQGGADWVQLTTWNDYSEHTHFAPSLHTGWAVADLTTYYTSWLKLGAPPPIVRDRLYWFHRPHSSTAKHDPKLQTGGAFTLRPDSGPFVDVIEVVVFAKEAATVEIELGGKLHSQPAPAGMSAFKIPLGPGKPVFQLSRNGQVVETLESPLTVSDTIGVQDLLYHSGSSTTCQRGSP